MEPHSAKKSFRLLFPAGLRVCLPICNMVPAKVDRNLRDNLLRVNYRQTKITAVAPQPGGWICFWGSPFRSNLNIQPIQKSNGVPQRPARPHLAAFNWIWAYSEWTEHFILESWYFWSNARPLCLTPAQTNGFWKFQPLVFSNLNKKRVWKIPDLRTTPQL